MDTSHEPTRTLRFYTESLSADRVVLPPGETHHALNVLRLKRNAEVELFDGRGHAASGVLVETPKSGAVVELTRHHPQIPRPTPRLHLAFSVPKGKRLDWLLEKATELGAASIRPVVFQHSISSGEMSDSKAQRWETHCVSAAKQCGLNFLPEILPPCSPQELLTRSPEIRWMVGDGRANFGSLSGLSWEAFREGDLGLIVGPEGGITAEEMHSLVAGGVLPVRLGYTTLRIETAAIALMAAVWALCETR